MIENEKLTFKLDIQGKRIIIALKGVIDEDADFGALKSLEGSLVFNFKEVSSINSCGVRNWVNFIKNVKNEAYLVECPPGIVRQLNMIPSFKGSTEVLSVFIPYVCDDCGHEKIELVTKEKFSDASIDFQELIKCDACGMEEMAFDGTAEQYFAFSKKAA